MENENKLTNNNNTNVGGRFQIRLSEIIELKRRMREINSYEVDNIDFLKDDGYPIEINQTFIDDFKFTGLSVIDFIDSGFYLEGFTEIKK